MPNLLFSCLLLLFLLVAPTSAALGDDGEWDYDKGGTDRDVDNDGEWDYDKGGTDRDLDNDGQWDYNLGGFDRDVDNDGEWDYDKGGTDRDLDNDGQWDYKLGGLRPGCGQPRPTGQRPTCPAPPLNFPCRPIEKPAQQAGFLYTMPPQRRARRGTEVVITALTRNQMVGLPDTWVRIPPSPP